VLFAFLTISALLSGQNLLGYKDYEIRKFMRENKGDMNYNKVSNNKFYYLKYTDSAEKQTMLFFMNKDSVCNSIRIICDAAITASKINEYNATLKKSGDSKWIGKQGGKQYLVAIKEEQWSNIITIEPFK